MDSGPQGIDDEAERAAIRRQARRVHLRSAAFALLVTAVFWVLP